MTPDPLSDHHSVNLDDIAAKAGVSRSTVSRVINNERYVSDRTRQRVLAVIEQVGFTPNPAARALVTQRTHVIGVILPIVPAALFGDAYYFPFLLQGISKAVGNYDYSLLLWMGYDDENDGRFHQRIVNDRLMDGVIIASAAHDDFLIEHFLKIRKPFVLVERPVHYIDRISYVTVDNAHAAYIIVSHLVALGHRKIGMITGDLTISDGQDRLAGYRQALEAASIQVDEELIIEGEFSLRAGYAGMRRLLEQRPDIEAVFAASDLIAQGILQALHEVGLKVPDDIALVGFDDLPTAQQISPPLTTIRQPTIEKGSEATSMLIELIESGDQQPRSRILPTQLVIRESCGASRMTHTGR